MAVRAGYRSVVLVAVSALVLATPPASATAAEVAKVVTAVKKAQPNFKAFCLKGPTAIRSEVTRVTATLHNSGQIKSDPTQVGAAAAQQIVADCLKLA